MKISASFLGAKTRCDGYFEGNGYIVTYAVGHLVGLYDMKDYDKDRYSGSWKFNNFPFIPQDKFKFKVDISKKKQFDIVKNLLHRDDIEYIIINEILDNRKIINLKKIKKEKVIN